MLKLIPEPTFKAPVKITVPGQEKPETITLVFKYMGVKDFEAFMAAEGKKKLTMTVPKVVLGWEGVEGEYTPENLSKILDGYPASSVEIWTEYNKQLFESRIKN